MQKKFIINLFFLLLLNLLIKPFWIFGIDREVQNITGAAEYGMYSSLLSFSFLFNILLDLGITNFNNRNIARNSHLLNKHFSGILLLRLLLAFLYCLISFSVGLLLGYDARQLSILLILLLNQALASFILYLRSNISGLQLFKTESIISVTDRALMILICSVLIWGTGSVITIEWFAWAQTAAYAITALITFLLVAHKAKLRRLTWDKNFFFVILKQSYPFALLILLMSFYYRIDAVMIERLLDDGALQAGIYAQAFRLLDAVNMFAYLISVLLLPMFSRMLKNGQSTEELVDLSFSFIAVPSIILMGFSVYYSEELMTLLYHEHIQESALVFQIVINCFLAISSVYIFGTLLTANGNLRHLNYVAFAGMVLNIALNFYFIPRFNAVGAAIAGLTTQYLAAGAQMLLAHRIFHYRLRWGLFFRYVLFAVLTYLLFAGMERYGISLAVALTAGSLICMAGSFGLFLIRPRSLMRVMKTTEVINRQ